MGADMPETPEEQIRKRVIGMIEPSFSEDVWSNPDPFVHRKIPIQDFTPYLLVKMLERLESIETTLDSMNSSMTDFWNSKYNS